MLPRVNWRLNFLFFILIFSACSPAETPRAEFALGTVCSVRLFEKADSRVYKEIFSRIREIDNRMSVNIVVSDISRVNAAAGIEPVQVHEDVFFVVQRALHYAQFSGGAFDPSIGPVVSLWEIGKNPRVPAQKEIDEVLPLVNWRNVELDAQTFSVFLKYPGMALDLGAIAKGYAADEAAAVIKSAGLKRAVIDLGGNIVILGRRKDKKPWRVGVQSPGEDRGVSIGILQITEPAGQTQNGNAAQMSVVTSGVYERFFEEDGRRYHHIFSPDDGRPAENELLSVTIITANSIDADALSTAAFVLGYEKGKALIESLPETEAVFIFEDKTVRKTDKADFILTDKTFRLED